METIDDDFDRKDVICVKVKVINDTSKTIIPLWSQDRALAAKYNVDEFPTLMFFENQIPSKVKILLLCVPLGHFASRRV